jgi:hypothetical protein
VVAELEILNAVVTTGLSGELAPETTLVPVQPVVPSAPEAFRIAFNSPAPPEAEAQLVLVPSVLRYLLALEPWLGNNAFSAVLAVVCPVPPLAIGRVPVTPVVSGSPVPLVKTTAEGVPRAGVTSVGLFANTRAPVPVSSVTAEARLALEGVPRNVATPVPNPEIPVDTGSPVPFVRVTAEGVPKSGVVKTGLVRVLFVRVSVLEIVGIFTLSNCNRLEAATARAKFALLAAFLQLTASVLDNRNTPDVAALAVRDVK